MRKPEIFIEYPSRGATYADACYGVYEYSTYPRSSVLAGQRRRVFLDSFETLAEATAAYPNADTSGCQYTPPCLNHLPDNEG